MATKLVPYTPALLSEFSAATGPWLYDLLTRRPALATCSSYWSISPSGPRGRLTEGGTRIGFEDDTEYFPAPVRRLLRQLLPVPPDVARAPDVATCRYQTLRFLLADPNLGLISVWSPSFLTLLLEFAREHADRLADDIAGGTLRLPKSDGEDAHDSTPFELPPPDAERAAAVREAFPSSGPLALQRVWPKLALVSCWTDAAARQQLPALLRLLPPSVEIQSKGLLATEGVVSFPLLGEPGAVLAVASHLIELRPTADPGARPVLAHEAELGGRYQPVLTTGGGLWRYPLGDEIEVVGRYGNTPLVRFRGRIDGVSDLCGEKLSPARVEDALSEALADARADVSFRLLAPTDGDPPSYTLYAEGRGDWTALEAALEARLRKGHHYDLCRKLGQLGPARVQSVDHGWERYERALMDRGQKAGNVKPSGLHSGQFWAGVFR